MLDFTPALRFLARRRISKLNGLDAAKTQEQQLLTLLQMAERTQFGREYRFSTIKSVAEYQERVPLRTYEDFWSRYWKKPYPVLYGVTWPDLTNFFAVSSGTSSGTTKYLPVTRRMINSNNRAGTDLFMHHLVNRPNSKLLGGKSFMLGGSTDLKFEAPEVMSGDLSGIAAITMPFWARARSYPPRNLALLKDWEEKIDAFVKGSLKEDIRFLGGVPAWLLIFVNKLRQYTNKPNANLVDFFPNLELVVHGGVNFEPYRVQFEALLEGSHAELREVYPASEGFIASADRGPNEGLRLNLAHGIFYEFVPVEELTSPNPTRHWVKNIELGVNYAIILSTCAGLWSYIIGDTVRFVDRKIPRLLVTGRTAYALSAFGEHLIAEEVEAAIAAACLETQSQIQDYAMGAVYPQSPQELGGHAVYIEFSGATPQAEQLERFATVFDQTLSQKNDDYAAHRSEGFGLASPKIYRVSPGSFAAWMKARGKLGGQNKVPRLISKPELFLNLSQFMNQQLIS